MKRTLFLLAAVFCFSISGLVLAGEIKIYSSEGVRTITVPGKEKISTETGYGGYRSGIRSQQLSPFPKRLPRRFPQRLKKKLITAATARKEKGSIRLFGLGLSIHKPGNSIRPSGERLSTLIRARSIRLVGGGVFNPDTGEFYPRVD